MEEPSRRGFMLAAVAVALGGCAQGFYRGAGERVVQEEVRKALPLEEPETPALRLYKKDPVYAGNPSADWQPDLTPLPRETWAIESPINHRLTPMGRVRRITVHHEGAVYPNDHTGIVEVAADIRDIRKVHLRVLGAGDIGYHYIIDRAGRIWAGRPAVYRGAHAGGEANSGNLGIMLLGNFDIQTPTERQKAALRAFLAGQMRRYALPFDSVFTHQELKPTRCPGKSLQHYMMQLRAGRLP